MVERTAFAGALALAVALGCQRGDRTRDQGKPTGPSDEKRSEFVRGASDDNPELARIYEEDQADRHGAPDDIDWSEVGPRDEQRRARVLELLTAGEVRSAADYFHAAMVFQHGSSLEDFQRAHDLAVEAVKLDPVGVNLVAA